MMSGHPTISMALEVVKLIVHGKKVETDCTFVFKNSGNACSVNRGFPDCGMWAYDMERKKPETMFKSFRSYVDGKAVKTKLVLGADKHEQWQAKTISFSKGGVRVVKEAYSTDLGGIAAWGFIGAASYILHTGASWNGPIGKATVTVEFSPELELATPFDIKYVASQANLKDKDFEEIQKPARLLVLGPGKPSVQGHSVVFEKRNWKPTKTDDILILFKFPTKLLEEERKQALQNAGRQ